MSRAQFHASLLVLLVSGYLYADESSVQTIFTSGEQGTALVELFTSEGCSSCPPADHWLSGLKADPGLWKEFVPVAFHVDYWDYIGWKDRFARAEFSERQRQYAQEGGTRVVYTPGVFRQGKDWRDWRSGKSATIDEPRTGELRVRVDGGRVEIHFSGAMPGTEQLTAHVALLGMNLETPVRAGENKGQRLLHDFVALNVVSTTLETSLSGYTAITQIPDTSVGVSELALAVWISAADAQKPIQSVGGYLPQSSASTESPEA